ncbi:hypothetical protein K2173_028546 [Erythroxylum novogranatense]|uniref:Uncharacterized protein n=1 Tax=Erythroxylum novogranatense TaxID=1862640 RepID=A0AAV8U5I6_9ROSI|nr:hypothetical protein K2173_028546 [Erythroxylum novogranatense]
MIGHTDVACPKRPPNSTASLPPRDCDDRVMNGQKNAGATTDGNTTAPTSNGYRLWTLMQNRPQRSSQPRQTQMGWQKILKAREQMVEEWVQHMEGIEAQEARLGIEEGTGQHPNDPPDISLESAETEAMPTQLPEQTLDSH